MNKKLGLLFATLMIASLVLGACQLEVVTKVVTQEVIKEVPKEVVTTVGPWLRQLPILTRAAPNRGGGGFGRAHVGIVSKLDLSGLGWFNLTAVTAVRGRSQR